MPNTYTAIQSVTVGSGGQASLEFTNIPAIYTDLAVLISPRNETNSGQMTMVFNNSTTSDYNRSKVFTDGQGGRYAGNETGQTVFNYIDLPLSSYGANSFGNVFVYIPNYAGSLRKSFSIDSVETNGAVDTCYVEFHGGIRTNTAAITSIKFAINSGNDFNQYTTAVLYGIKKD